VESWLVVAAVGAVVLVVVFGLQLFPRLGDGQKVLDGLRPAMTEAQVTTARSGVDIVQTIVDTFDPLVLEGGGGTAEVPALVAFVATATGLPEDQVVATLQERFRHVLGLLRALPLEAVTAELAQLVPFLAETIGITPDEVVAALQQNVPRLAQAITNLPSVTAGWADVPGTPGTRVDGSEISSLTDISRYFSDDVVPVLERQGGHFRDLDSMPGGVGFLPTLLVIVGAVVLLFGAAMAVAGARGALSPGLATVGWGVVVGVGAAVLIVVAGLQLYPRLFGAQDLLDDAKPIFTTDRIESARGGIDIVSTIVDTADPLVLQAGGGAAEVPTLVAFTAASTGLSEGAVMTVLGEQFPHLLGLLQALPLETVTAELAELVPFLAEATGASTDDIAGALQQNVPHLAQSITLLPTVTAQWADVSSTDGARFDGGAINSVSDVREYFRDDLIPAVAGQRSAFHSLESTWPPTYVFPPLLTVVGIGVVAYGLVMLLAARKEPQTG
jgi:hypothetical protein